MTEIKIKATCVVRRYIIWAVILAFLANPRNMQSSPHAKKALVRFIATGTLVRGTFGRNEDAYLAELTLPAESTPDLVRLIDAYPNRYPALSSAVLTAPSGTKLLVQRDPQCDLPYAQMVLRAPPGDPITLVRGKLDYQPKLSKRPTQDAILPCYRVVRR